MIDDIFFIFIDALVDQYTKNELDHLIGDILKRAGRSCVKAASVAVVEPEIVEPDEDSE